MWWTLLSSRGREPGHQFSGYPSAVFHLGALRLCRSRTSVPSARSPVSCVRPGWPPGTVLARRAARTYRAIASRSARGMPGVQAGFLLGALRPEADGAVTFGVAADARSRGSAGCQDGVSDSDPRTLAEYVTHCPKIFVR
jgi:hypothetical protein